MSSGGEFIKMWGLRAFYLGLVAHVDHERQRMSAGLGDFVRGGEDRAGQFRMRLVGLGRDGDVGAVARGAQRNRKPDAARCAGDEQRAVFEHSPLPVGPVAAFGSNEFHASAASASLTLSAASTTVRSRLAACTARFSAKKRAIAVRPAASAALPASRIAASASSARSAPPAASA